jgi:dipeptidyl aminopeptidase/acylaminoacyl peptidase
VQAAEPAQATATATVAPSVAPPPTATLIVEGAPEPPEALRARLHQYLETRSASVASISSDGKSLLVRTRFGETPQIHLVGAPLGARRQLTFDDEPIASATFVPGEPDALWFTRDKGGAEDYQIFRLDLTNGRAELLTDGKSRHQSLVIERKGKRIAYASNARNGRDMDLYVADGRKKESARLLLEVQGTYAPLDFSRDGKWLLASHYVSIQESELYVVELATGKARQITQGPKAAYRSAFFDASGKRVYAASDREGEMNELYEIAIDKEPSSFRSLTRDIKWNVELVRLSPDGKTIALVVNEEGYGTLHLLDTQTRAHRVAKNLPRAVISRLDYAENADTLGLSLARATSATDAYTYDVKKQKLVRYTESEMGGLDQSSFVEPALVRFDSFDGLSVPAFVYKPRGAGPFPVVIDIHGGPESQARPVFHPLAQYLARESGIATIVPNVRGSDGYGKRYLSLDNGKLREDSVKDIGALLDFVAKDSTLDAKRVAVMGGSYGGYMVLASLVHHGARLRGGIDVVGIANFVTFLENTRDYRRDLRRVEYGDESNPEMRAFLTDISPLTHVDRITSALFVAHGTNDPRVPVGEAEQIARAVREKGREVWTLVATNEGHGFQKKENRDRYSELAVMFLERTLENK